ncbi:MAG TPA: tetratricopeptide repeat protein, partial [Alphaproteobacteria bacterium]|nr:tetratricopeptide repeat protein [Alphaproteobacteria bacterium]
APLKKKKKFRLFEAYHRALINDLAGRTEAADAAFREVTAKQDFRSLRVVEAYGGFLARQGRFDEATAFYRSYLEEVRDPDNPMILEALQRSQSQQAPARLVPDVKAGLAEVFYGVAAAAAQGQTREVAKVYVQLAIHLKPSSAVALTLLGGLLDQDERTAEANAVYARIEHQTAYGWRARIRMADNLNRLDKIEGAAKLLRSMATERPERIDALVALGDILRGHERYAESAGVYDQAIARVGKPETKHWTLFYARGISRERTQRWPEAERDFLTSLELKPDQALVLNYLGYSWIDRGEHLDKARKLIERAVELRPRDGYIIDSLGWVLYRLGEFEGAVKQLERAVSLRPQDPIINDHLGDAYWRAGRRLEAVFQWRHALVLKPAKDAIPEIQEKLRQGLKDEQKPDLKPGDQDATGN